MDDKLYYITEEPEKLRMIMYESYEGLYYNLGNLRNEIKILMDILDKMEIKEYSKSDFNNKKSNILAEINKAKNIIETIETRRS